MGIFGKGEGYSPAEYENAEERRHWLETRGLQEGAEAYDNQNYLREALLRLERERRQARKLVEKLFGQAQKEAEAINKEYDRLLDRASKALEELQTFETKKLGKNPKQESKV